MPNMSKKYKGFSKLPEAVQQKMDPEAAMKYMEGGAVKKYMGGGAVKKYEAGGAVRSNKKKPKMGCVMKGRGGKYKGQR